MSFLKNQSAAQQWVMFQWIVVIINLVLKFVYITANSIGLDEPFSIFHSQLNPTLIASELSSGNNPPLFEIVLHYWIELFGIGSLSVRFLPCLFSCLTALLILRMVKTWRGINTAIVASLLFTFSTYHMQFAHEARTYSLFCLLSVMSFNVFLKLKDGKKRNIFLWTLANVALVYTHYLGFAIPIIQVFILILFGGVRKQSLVLVTTMIIGLMISYLPWIGVLIDRVSQTTSAGTWITPAKAEDLYNCIWSFSNSPLVAVLFLILLVVWSTLIVSKRVKTDSFIKQISVWFFIPLLGMFLISWSVLPFNLPLFIDRYLIFFSPAFYILIACAFTDVVAVFNIHRSVLILPCIAMAVTFNLNPDNKRHVAETINRLHELATPSTLILFAPEDFKLNFAYYYDRSIFMQYSEKPIYSKLDSSLNHSNIYGINMLSDLNDLNIQSFDRVIYLDAGSSFMWNNNGIKDTLVKARALKSEEKFKDIFTLYEFK